MLEEFFDDRFGPEEMRHSVCYYEVKPEQNLTETEIVKLYKDKGGLSMIETNRYGIPDSGFLPFSISGHFIYLSNLRRLCLVHWRPLSYVFV